MRWSVLVFLVAALWSGVVARNCVLKYDYQAPGIFLQKNNDQFTIIASGDGEIPVPDGGTIQGFCSTKFTNLGLQAYDGIFANITFTCTNGKITYLPAANYAPLGLDSSEMHCQGEALFYEATVPYCQSTGLQYGFQIANTSISLAELCYNSDSARSIFVHFVLGQRSDLLANQAKLNPSNISTIISQQTFSFDNTLESQKTSLRNAIDEFAPLLSADIEYDFDGLAPLNLLSDMFIQYTDNFNNSNLIPWWKPLKNGNWRAVTAAMENLQATGIFDIYMGTSGSVVYPNNPFDEIIQLLTYQNGNIMETVPLLIWTYVKERNSQDKGVVIIAVNTPFFDENNNNAFMCNDVCHNSDWLSSILVTSHMPALGFVYCCHPDDVQMSLNGFPQI